LDIPY